jgi:hypothetical protein
VQTPPRGSTYITKWDVSSFSPIITVKATDSIITSVDYSEKFGILGMGDNNGKLIFFNSSGLTKAGEKTIAEITVKTVSFKNNTLICGTADNALTINDIIRGSSISFSFHLKLIFLAIFIFYILNKKY